MDKLSLVIVGHVDHGKSSLIGRILYDTKSVSDDKIEELRKASKNTENELEFAFLLDHLKEEREQGITIDTTQTFFHFKNKQYVIIDAPGHVEFVKNMVTGASQADSAILIIDAEEGIKEQTIRHSFVLSLLGIRQVIVVVNKMDLVGFSEERFNYLVNETKEFLKTMNIGTDYFVPVSAITGENVCSASKCMEWYQGITVMEILEKFRVEEKKEQKINAFAVQDVYKIKDKRIVVGKLESGTIKKGDKVHILPSNLSSTITSLEKYNETCERCEEGDCFGVVMEDPLFVERGNIIGNKTDKIKNTKGITASIFWMDRSSVTKGDKLILRCSTQEVPITITAINKKISTNTINEKIIDVDCLNNLDAGEISISSKKEMSVSCFNELAELGRFVLVKNDNICAGGIITNLS